MATAGVPADAITVTFWGAAHTVTGSMHLVQAGRQRILLDCGLFQGKRAEAWARNKDFPFPPLSTRHSPLVLGEPCPHRSLWQPAEPGPRNARPAARRKAAGSPHSEYDLQATGGGRGDERLLAGTPGE